MNPVSRNEFSRVKTQRQCGPRGPVPWKIVIQVVVLFLVFTTFLRLRAYRLEFGIFRDDLSYDEEETGKDDCSQQVGRGEIDELCDMYHRGILTGDLCAPLCDHGQIRFANCVHLGHVQKKVIIVQCTDACKEGHTVPAVLKTASDNVESWLRKYGPWRKPSDPSQDLHKASRELIDKYVNIYMGFDPFKGKDPFKVVWSQGSERDLRSAEYAAAVWRSLMLLMPVMRQSEFMLSKTFADSGLFPKIYSSCGHYYLQESCPPGAVDWIPPDLADEEQRKASWIGRARDALTMLELLDKLEKNFPDQLIGCDFKFENFGYCRDGKLRIIDNNSFFFNSSGVFQVPMKCPAPNVSCQIAGRKCVGTCNSQQNVCVLRNNVNLEYTCRSIFMVRENMIHPFHTVDGTGRLLRDPPPSVAADMDRVLHTCEALSQLYFVEPGIRLQVQNELKSLLKRSILQPEYY